VAELPEIEILKQQLSKEIVGRKVKTAAITNSKTVTGNKTAKGFRDLLEGRIIKDVMRLGGSLVCGLDSGNTLVITLGETGQLRRTKSAKEAKEKHTAAILAFTVGGELRLVDPKGQARMFVSHPPAEGSKLTISGSAAIAVGGEGRNTRLRVPELAMLGFDPMEDVMSWERFAIVLRAKSVTVRSFLVNQEMVSGVGDLYADEILFGSGLNPARLTDSLSTTEVRRLWRSLVELLAESIKHSGASLEGENTFRDIFGKTGNFAQFIEVHGRDGQSCRRCRREIAKVKSGTRTIYVCEHCQI
jgi:formamidopyrimidine-DNA glycosylase